jgi:hypothetical protein
MNLVSQPKETEVDWKSLVDGFTKIGLPLLGSVLPLPGAGALCSVLASVINSPSTAPQDILAHLTQNADALLKAKQFEGQHSETMLKMRMDAEIAERQEDNAAMQMVNQTMQAEAKSEHWLQWVWRPLNGIALAIGSIATVLGVLWFSWVAIREKDMAMMNAIPILLNSIAMAMAIPGAVCGVTAWHRGMTQRLQIAAGKG